MINSPFRGGEQGDESKEVGSPRRPAPETALAGNDHDTRLYEDVFW